MKFVKYYCIVVLLLISGTTLAQEAPAYAVKNVMIHHSDGSIENNATIVWRNGIIEAIGVEVEIPFDAYTYEFDTYMHLFPGFIDGLGTWGAPKQPDAKRPADPGNPGYERAGIQPERAPSKHVEGDHKDFKSLIGGGFTTAALTFNGNMMPGQVEVFHISTENVDELVYKHEIAQYAKLATSGGGWSSRAYPNTVMGVMARFRQLMYDATALQDHINYHESNPNMPSPNRDEVLESLFPVINGDMPLYFEADSKEDIQYVMKLKREFDFNLVLVSGKQAYTMADEIAKAKVPVLVSMDIPDTPKWYEEEKKAAKKAEEEAKKEAEEDDENSDEDEEDDSDDEKKEEEKAEELSDEEKNYRARQLERFKADVANAKTLMDAGVKVGYASNGLKTSDLLKNAFVVMEESEMTFNDLLKVLTINTADILGISKATGSLENGKIANFMLFDKVPTDAKGAPKHVVANGKMHDF